VGDFRKGQNQRQGKFVESGHYFKILEQHPHVTLRFFVELYSKGLAPSSISISLFPQNLQFLFTSKHHYIQEKTKWAQ